MKELAYRWKGIEWIQFRSWFESMKGIYNGQHQRHYTYHHLHNTAKIFVFIFTFRTKRKKKNVTRAKWVERLKFFFEKNLILLKISLLKCFDQEKKKKKLKLYVVVKIIIIWMFLLDIFFRVYKISSSAKKIWACNKLNKKKKLVKEIPKFTKLFRFNLFFGEKMKF